MLYYFNDAIEKAIINEKKILSLPMFPDLKKKKLHMYVIFKIL